MIRSHLLPAPACVLAALLLVPAAAPAAGQPGFNGAWTGATSYQPTVLIKRGKVTKIDAWVTSPRGRCNRAVDLPARGLAIRGGRFAYRKNTRNGKWYSRTTITGRFSADYRRVTLTWSGAWNFVSEDGPGSCHLAPRSITLNLESFTLDGRTGSGQKISLGLQWNGLRDGLIGWDLLLGDEDGSAFYPTLMCTCRNDDGTVTTESFEGPVQLVNTKVARATGAFSHQITGDNSTQRAVGTVPAWASLADGAPVTGTISYANENCSGSDSITLTATPGWWRR